MTNNTKNEAAAVITRTTDFWVVTKPTELSMVVDICFETDLAGLQRQFAGGLDAKDILGIWLDRYAAERAAQRLLEER